MTDPSSADPAVPGSGKNPAAGGPACRVCGEPLAGQAAVACCACGTMHHDQCWRFNRGCSVYGCGSRSATAPEPGLMRLPGGSFDLVTRLHPGWTILSAAAVACSLMGLILGTEGALELIPLFANALLLSVAATIAAAASRVRLRFDAAAGAVHRDWLLFGRPIRSRPNWLSAREVVELHLHERVLAGGIKGPSSSFTLHALLADGRRRVILREHAPVMTDERRKEVTEKAERIAEFSDCTVRRFSGDAKPSREEMARAIEQWRLDSSRSRPALPAPPTSEPPLPAQADGE